MSHRPAIESCTINLHTWRPFSDSAKPFTAAKTAVKRPCRADRRTSFAVEAAAIDMSRLSLFDDDRTLSNGSKKIRWFARKRRRRGSRSVSGRSSDRSRRCCSVGASAAAYGTCSDFPVATDSSGELFVMNGGDPNWSSDVSEAARNSRMGKKERDGGSGERENMGAGLGQNGNVESGQQHPGQGNESGYGSEPGYRGDAEFGYGDEFDEEEDDPRIPFWGEQFGADTISKLERVGENSLQKTHHRGRRKKHDIRMIDALG